ncbi:NAD(P)H-binding protein [Nocardia cerradoensis]|uniref:NAD(P)H azoreductase n=1 Tax=Nocardia cerradoensis TaxID=85688 RepID=A0A231H9J1_9NOCA|nr:NAD(P)H-binding protein [Nocardia cerradoensis]NKY48244.1 NAD(P)H-binding protein [Nocardia cerradoensis]OXR45500.1 NAD(P)H azoreductase [Nocardia cerradoensis]
MVTVVFGARGNVGRHVAAGLIAAGEKIRVTSRRPGDASFTPEVEVVAADLERPETFPAALDGARRVFLYAKPAGIDGFVAAAEAAGVRQVVLLSSGAVLHADTGNPIARDHLAVESAIEKSGLPWTFIRPGMFATNTLWWWRTSIRDEGVVRVPYPEARTAPIHEKDLASLAVTALTEPGHEGRAYPVYGPEAVTVREQVEQIGAALGRDIALEVISPERARIELGKTMPPVGVEAILGGWRAGTVTPPQISTVIADITGRPARTFAQWAADHRDDFR